MFRKYRLLILITLILACFVVTVFPVLGEPDDGSTDTINVTLTSATPAANLSAGRDPLPEEGSPGNSTSSPGDVPVVTPAVNLSADRDPLPEEGSPGNSTPASGEVPAGSPPDWTGPLGPPLLNQTHEGRDPGPNTTIKGEAASPQGSTIVWDSPVDIESAPYQAGYGASMVRDPNTGRLHLSYIEYSNETDYPGMLIYQTGNGTDWDEPVIVDQSIGFYHRDVPESVRHTSIALGPDGNPHIAYMSWNQGYHLKYARMLRPGEITYTHSALGWEPARPTGSADEDVTIYGGVEQVNGNWLVASLVPKGGFNGWGTVSKGGFREGDVVPKSGLYGWGASIAVDRNDAAHISYLAQEGYSSPVFVAYGTYNESIIEIQSGGHKTGAHEKVFTFESVVISSLYGELPFTYWREPVRAGAVTSIALDSAGTPHISYSGSSTGYPHFSLKSDSGCGFTESCTADLHVVHVSLKPDAPPGSPPLFVFWKFVQPGQDREFSDTTTSLYSSMAIDARDNVHISSSDSVDPVIKISQFKRRPVTLGTASTVSGDARSEDSLGTYGSLTYSTLDRSSDRSSSSSADTSPAGTGQYSSRSSDRSSSSSVDTSPAGTGQYSSLQLDAAGNPGIAYVNAADGAVRYATRSNDAWVISTPPGQEQIRAQFTTLALDADGDPQIVFLDTTSGSLKYLHGRHTS